MLQMINHPNLSLIKFGPKANSEKIHIDSSSQFTGKFDVHVIGENCVLEIGRNCILANFSIFLYGNNSLVSIGENVRCNSSLWANLSEPNTTFSLGNNCLLANVRVRTSDSHHLLDSNTHERINPPGDVIVREHVWIAEDVLLLKGTDIGQDCVVGAKSLVNSLMPPQSLVGGVPARVLRTGITWR